MLQQPDIAHYLLSLDVFAPRAVVDDELAIVDVSRRNGVFLAVARTGDVIVVKQAGPHSAATLAHEARILTALAGYPATGREGTRGDALRPRRRPHSSCAPGGRTGLGSTHRGRPGTPRDASAGWWRALHGSAPKARALPPGTDPMWGSRS